MITRSEAKQKGLTRYFTGGACKHGHIAERYTRNGACSECEDARRRVNQADPDFAERGREYARQYQAKVRSTAEGLERLKRNKRRSSQNRKDYIADWQKAYRERNKEHISAFKLRWFKEKYRIDTTFRANIIARGHIRRAIRLIQGKVNGECLSLGYDHSTLARHLEHTAGKPLDWSTYGSTWEVDHIVPVSLLVARGIHDPRVINSLINLRAVPRNINVEKGARYYDAIVLEKILAMV